MEKVGITDEDIGEFCDIAISKSLLQNECDTGFFFHA